ncbi:hypothetical protein K443DRAFT_680907 [Laccaria amethystina LaAM-08-1]|uniref:Uncharacterized protein n=1 Tax=Laccaria amethystina LaAM-08-1 TaxID=1095629 RepID=A0A0C9WZH6_9AGAR|nr:hypothetical protein K443DRAFT_680907 [Laccaria amethystina LaAM-08-1]
MPWTAAIFPVKPKLDENQISFRPPSPGRHPYRICLENPNKFGDWAVSIPGRPLMIAEPGPPSGRTSSRKSGGGVVLFPDEKWQEQPQVRSVENWRFKLERSMY